MVYRTALLALTALGVIVLACSQARAATKQTEEFVTAAISSNTFEIESSKVALKRSQNTAIKDFAQRMIADHDRAGQEMQATLATAGIETPSAEGLNEEHREVLEKLKAAGPAEFDREYVSAQTDAHNEAVDLFKQYSEDGDQSDLKEFAMHTLPILQGHKDQVQALQVSQ